MLQEELNYRFLADFLDLFYALCKAILTFAEFVSLCKGQHRNQPQKFVDCILDYNLHIITITEI